MHQIAIRLFPSSSRRAGLAFLIVLMCICVGAQMLGTSITLISLLTADMSLESASADFSIPSVLRQARLTSHRFLYGKTDHSRYQTMFDSPAFHPPRA